MHAYACSWAQQLQTAWHLQKAVLPKIKRRVYMSFVLQARSQAKQHPHLDIIVVLACKVENRQAQNVGINRQHARGRDNLRVILP
jgi:hypothetical protein